MRFDGERNISGGGVVPLSIGSVRVGLVEVAVPLSVGAVG